MLVETTVVARVNIFFAAVGRRHLGLCIHRSLCEPWQTGALDEIP
jgi:hypothetical protein